MCIEPSITKVNVCMESFDNCDIEGGQVEALAPPTTNISNKLITPDANRISLMHMK